MYLSFNLESIQLTSILTKNNTSRKKSKKTKMGKLKQNQVILWLISLQKFRINFSNMCHICLILLAEQMKSKNRKNNYGEANWNIKLCLSQWVTVETTSPKTKYNMELMTKQKWIWVKRSHMLMEIPRKSITKQSLS